MSPLGPIVADIHPPAWAAQMYRQRPICEGSNASQRGNWRQHASNTPPHFIDIVNRLPGPSPATGDPRDFRISNVGTIR
jgi:hypothetical protein